MSTRAISGNAATGFQRKIMIGKKIQPPQQRTPKREIKAKILILGGSEPAYLLAQKLHDLPPSCPLHVTSSLAGRTKTPRPPAGNWRIGGFGGIDGLVKFLQMQKISVMIDATHPFARIISTHAEVAARQASVPLLRLKNSPWHQHPQDKWLMVDNISQAVSLLPDGARVFLALGRRHLDIFSQRHKVQFVARMLTQPENFSPPANFTILFGKPASAADETTLLRNEKINYLVCRNSGAKASYGKITAARTLSLPVVMISRPQQEENIPTFTTIESLQEKLRALLNFI